MFVFIVVYLNLLIQFGVILNLMKYYTTRCGKYTPKAVRHTCNTQCMTLISIIRNVAHDKSMIRVCVSRQ